MMYNHRRFPPHPSPTTATELNCYLDALSRLKTVQAIEKNDQLVDVDPVTAGNQPETETYGYELNDNLDLEINPDGSTTDYTYDSLNRLTDIDETRADGTPLSEYSYTLRDDGKRESAAEKIYADDGSLISHTQFDWTYDDAGRLTDEVFTRRNKGVEIRGHFTFTISSMSPFRLPFRLFLQHPKNTDQHQSLSKPRHREDSFGTKWQDGNILLLQ